MVASPWQKSALPTAAEPWGQLTAVTAADGGFIAAGAHFPADTSAPARPLLIAFNGSGSVKWHRVLPLGTMLRTIIAHPGGGLFVAGTNYPSPSHRYAWLAGLDMSGGVRWSRQVDKIESGLATGIAAMKSGGLAVVGGEMNWANAIPKFANVLACPSKTSCSAYVARTDAFGHTDCNTAGGCAAKTAKDCDDGDPCTLDGCAASKGCFHVQSNAPACKP